MNNKDSSNQCQCTGAPKLIFPCSGAADVGEISDRAARRLTKEGKGKMFCLAGVGGRVPDLLAKVSSAQKILVIDGCETECARQTLVGAGFKTFEHLRLKSLGFEKGQSPATFDNIQRVVNKAAELLGA